MNNKIIIPAILSSYRPKADGSWSVTLSTNILTKPEKECIDNMHNQLVAVMIKEGEIDKADGSILDSIDTDLMDKDKTPSKRLRNVLFKLWEQSGTGDFKDFYKTKMEQIIEHYKSKLD